MVGQISRIGQASKTHVQTKKKEKEKSSENGTRVDGKPDFLIDVHGTVVPLNDYEKVRTANWPLEKQQSRTFACRAIQIRQRQTNKVEA